MEVVSSWGAKYWSICIPVQLHDLSMLRKLEKLVACNGCLQLSITPWDLQIRELERQELEHPMELELTRAEVNLFDAAIKYVHSSLRTARPGTASKDAVADHNLALIDYEVQKRQDLEGLFAEGLCQPMDNLSLFFNSQYMLRYDNTGAWNDYLQPGFGFVLNFTIPILLLPIAPGRYEYQIFLFKSFLIVSYLDCCLS